MIITINIGEKPLLKTCSNCKNETFGGCKLPIKKASDCQLTMFYGGEFKHFEAK